MTLQNVAVVLVLALALHSSLILNHFGANAFRFPDPKRDYQLCGHPLPDDDSLSVNAVCDPEKYLSKDAVTRMNKELETIEKEILCDKCDEPRGYQVALVIVDSMFNANYDFRAASYFNHEATEDDARNFARSLHDLYGVGYHDCQNGVVVFLAIKDRKMYISTGREARIVLTDTLTARVIERMKSYLRAGDYDGALEKCVADMKLILSGKAGTEFDEEDNSYLGICLIVGLVSLFGFVSYAAYKENKKKEVLRRKLTAIEKQRANELAEKYKQTHCPICLEDFPADKKETSLLPCGHRFCRTCLSEWTKTSPSCPVCREAPSENNDPDAPPTESCNNTNNSSTYSGRRTRRYTSTVPFELMMLRNQYPRYITPGLYSRWTASDYTGSYTADPQFVTALNPPASTSSSSSRSSSRWGGGGSYGGGGSGGSW